jgi:hypothetical protein
MDCGLNRPIINHAALQKRGCTALSERKFPARFRLAGMSSYRREREMRRFLAIAALASGLLGAAGAAQAQERLIDGALGAGAGALVGGPVGAVAGGAIGYSAGPHISRGMRGGRHHYRHRHYRRHRYYR